MAEGKIFVGRKAELEQFNEVLKNPKGQAVLVVGQAGMGKTWLVNEVVKKAEKGIIGKEVLKVKCWSVSYQITPTDDVNKTMEQIIMEATDAASPTKKKMGMTGQSKDKWSALFGASEMVPVLGKKVKAFGELLLSWGEQKTGDTRTRFMKALEKLSDCMSDEKRAIFIIDPEKWMPKDSDHAWRLVVSDLPDKVKLVFPQRPDDVLVTSDEFCLLKNVMRVPSDELDVLDDEAIDDLVDKYSKRTKYSTNEIHDAVECYKGHPYAVGAALELIVDGLEIEKLPNDPRPVAIAEAQWGRMCERGDDAIALFEAYAILEVGVPDDIVKVVSGLGATTRKRLQKDSYLKGLLREEGEGRRIYHAILMDYINEQIGEAEKSKYHLRAMWIYRERLHKDIKPDVLAAMRLAEHVLAAEGKDKFVDSFVSECGKALMDLGLFDTFISLSERALSMVEKDSEEEAMVTGNLGLVYKTRGNLDKAEEMHLKSLGIGKKLGWLEGMAADYGNLGMIYRRRGEFDKAEKMYLKSLEISEPHGMLELTANQYGNLGAMYYTRGELDKAEEMYRDGLKIDEKLSRLEGMAAKYGNLGLIYKDKGELDKAEGMILKSLKIAEELGLQELMANDYGNLGVIYGMRGELDKAEKMFRDGLKIDEKLGRLEGMAAKYGNLGLIYKDKGELDKAEGMYLKSLEIDKKIGRLEGMVSDYDNLGIVYKQQGEIDKAEEMYKGALEIAEKIGHQEIIGIVYGNLGNVYQMRGELNKAEEMYKKSMEIGEKLGLHEVMACDYAALGLVHYLRGDLGDAEKMHIKGLEIEKKLGRLEGMARQYSNLGSVYEHRGDIGKAKEYWEKAVELYKKIGMPNEVEKVEGWIEELKDK